MTMYCTCNFKFKIPALKVTCFKFLWVLFSSINHRHFWKILSLGWIHITKSRHISIILINTDLMSNHNEPCMISEWVCPIGSRPQAFQQTICSWVLCPHDEYLSSIVWLPDPLDVKTAGTAGDDACGMLMCLVWNHKWLAYNRCDSYKAVVSTLWHSCLFK